MFIGLLGGPVAPMGFLGGPKRLLAVLIGLLGILIVVLVAGLGYLILLELIVRLW